MDRLYLQVPEKDWLITECCLFMREIMVITIEYILRIQTSILA